MKTNLRFFDDISQLEAPNKVPSFIRFDEKHPWLRTETSGGELLEFLIGGSWNSVPNCTKIVPFVQG